MNYYLFGLGTIFGGSCSAAGFLFMRYIQRGRASENKKSPFSADFTEKGLKKIKDIQVLADIETEGEVLVDALNFLEWGARVIEIGGSFLVKLDTGKIVAVKIDLFKKIKIKSAKAKETDNEKVDWDQYFDNKDV